MLVDMHTSSRDLSVRRFSKLQCSLLAEATKISASNKKRLRTISLWTKIVSELGSIDKFELMNPTSFAVDLGLDSVEGSEPNSEIVAFNASPIHIMLDGYKELAEREVGLILKVRRLPKKIRKNLRGKIRAKTEPCVIVENDRFKYNIRFYKAIALNELISQKIILDSTSLQCRINVEAISTAMSIGLDELWGSRILKTVQLEMWMQYLEFGSVKV